MCKVISLSAYRKSIEKKKEDTELISLQSSVEEIMTLIGDIEPKPYYTPSELEIDNLIYGGLEIGPSESALFNAYYTLLYDGREDLAELVMEIIKMK